MRLFFLLSFLLINVFIQAASKPLNKVKVKVEAVGAVRQNSIASFDISSYAPVPEGFQIVVKTADGRICLSQVNHCPQSKMSTLYWRIDDPMKENESLVFNIETTASTVSTAIMDTVKDRSGNIILKKYNTKVVQYNTVPPSLYGLDASYKRNGYIHPAWSPAGNVLTNSNPDDHWHHYGIWNPWTSVEYDNQHYDLWNIADKRGTVRFDSLYRSSSGPLFTDIVVRHRHVIYQPQKEEVTNHIWGILRFTPKHEKIIMDEIQCIRVWNVKDAFVWDINFTLYPSTAIPVILKEYRYAGLGWRATRDWTKDNCQMITSEGKTRQEIDGTKARWIYAQGMGPKGKSGMLMMASPNNHNFPEPLRIWDESANYGRGDVFINFAPTKYEDWILEPGQSYDFHYRMFSYDGDITPEKAEAVWKDYSLPVKVTVYK